MGAGKSAIGRRLAARLGMAFVDSDHEVERAAGRPVAEIFAHCGEAAFRESERRTMARLLAGPPSVLAAGGGAFLAAETRAAIRARGISVWLRVPLDVLAARVARNDDRPLLKGGDARDILQRLMVERYPTYGEADIVVDGGDDPHERTLQRVLGALEAFEAGHASAAGQAPALKGG